MRNRLLVVEGRASPAAVARCATGLPLNRPANSEVLFLSFAYADIPLGRRFCFLFPSGQPTLATHAECRILAVTQQFAKPFGEVPHGWKTICLVQFEAGIPHCVSSLPEVDGWYENRNTLCVCDEETFRLIGARDGTQAG